ncbi:MAG: 16S rRNA (cytosine(1402)-N(4))-methyltransferase RsmH [Chitinophagales bacterium]
MSVYHETVLLTEAVDGLAIKPDGIYVDVTFGSGGHSMKIIEQLEKGKGKLYAFDQDQDAKANLFEDERLVFIPQNFRYLKQYLRLEGVRKIDGLLADLGVSWHQFNTTERGFSFRFGESELDMRMDSNVEITAQSILNTYKKQELFDIFKFYGELPNALHLAEAVVTARQLSKIKTVSQLLTVASPCVRGKRNKFLAQLFQALRIEVNGEMDALKELLNQSSEILKKDGRLVVIAYHSLEDRLVKNFIKKGNFEGKDDKDIFGNSHQPFKAINRKVIIPSPKEISKNPKSRSAKMRIAERVISD